MHQTQTARTSLNSPIVALAATGDRRLPLRGFGGVFCFGQAAFDGSAGGQPLAAPVSSMAPDQATGGYWLAGTSGIVYNFGGAAAF